MSNKDEDAEKSTTRLYIGNKDLQELDLHDLFGQYGEIDRISCLQDYSFVEMKEPTEAKLCIEQLNGVELNGQKLIIEYAHGKKTKALCYNCGKPGHRMSDCPLKEPVCYRCKELGHIARNCTRDLDGGRYRRSRSPPYGHRRGGGMLMDREAEAIKPSDTRMYIGNAGMKEEELIEAFGKYGVIDRINCLEDYAFVEMKSPRDAEDCVKNLNGAEVAGKVLTVEFAHGAKSKGACFNCGKPGHRKRDCPVKDPVCYTCKGVGHIAKDCRKEPDRYYERNYRRSRSRSPYYRRRSLSPPYYRRRRRSPGYRERIRSPGYRDRYDERLYRRYSPRYYRYRSRSPPRRDDRYRRYSPPHSRFPYPPRERDLPISRGRNPPIDRYRDHGPGGPLPRYLPPRNLPGDPPLRGSFADTLPPRDIADPSWTRIGA